MYIEPENKVWKKIEEIVSYGGLLLYDVRKLDRGGYQVFIDRRLSGSDEKQFGVSSDECVEVCRELLLFFRKEASEYGFSDDSRVEVSSPGVSRKMRLEGHFRSAVGKLVKVKYEDSVDGVCKNVSVLGRLVDFDGQCLRVKASVDGKIIEFCSRLFEKLV